MQQNEADEINVRNRTKKIIYLTLFVALISLVGIVIINLSNSSGNSTLLDNKFYKQSYDIYAPTILPEKYSLNTGSMESNPTFTTYTISSQNPEDIYFVSIQPLPRQTIIDDFLKNQMSGAASVDSSIGSAMIGVVSGRETASVVTKKSWVIITSPLGSKRGDLQLIVSGLRNSTGKQ